MRSFRTRRADSLGAEGAALLAEGRLGEARAVLRQAAEAFLKAGDRPRAALAYSDAGHAAFEAGEFGAAVDIHLRAVGLIVQVWELGLQAVIRLRLGLALARTGDRTGALRELGLAADAFDEVDDPGRQALALLARGDVLHETFRFREALAVHERALALFRETGNRTGEAGALNGVGVALDGAGRGEEAVASLRAAAALFAERGERGGEGLAEANLGRALGNLGRFDEANAAFEAALPLLRAGGEDAAAARVLADLQDAREAGDGVPSDRDPAHQAGDALNERGLELLRADRCAEAETLFEEARAIFRRLGDRRDEATTLANVGLSLRGQDRSEEAVARLDEALALAAGDGEVADRIAADLGSTLTDRGTAFVAERRFADAIATHRRAVGLLTEHGDRHGRGCALNNLAVALYGSQRLAEAEEAYDEAVAIFRDTGDRAREGAALDGRGRSLAMLRRPAEAVDSHRAAAACFREVGDAPREGETLMFLGAAQHLAGRSGEAEATLRDAIALLERSGERAQAALATGLLAQVEAREPLL